MQIILIQDVPSLGRKDDVVKVKDGFALNFLIPGKKAVPATPEAMRQADSRRKERIVKAEEALENAQELKDKLKGVTLTFKRKTKGEKLFGSVNEKDVINAVKEQCKVELTKEMVEMKEHIKALGKHEVTVRLTPEMSVVMKVEVEAE